MSVRAKPGRWSLSHQEETLPLCPQHVRAAVRGSRCGGSQAAGNSRGSPDQRGPCPRHRKGGQGLRHRRQKGQCCATAHKNSKSPPPPIVYSALSLLPLHTQNQAGNFHNNKAGMEFLFWKIFNISSSFGSYRMKLFFLQEEEEIIS